MDETPVPEIRFGSVIAYRSWKILVDPRTGLPCLCSSGIAPHWLYLTKPELVIFIQKYRWDYGCNKATCMDVRVSKHDAPELNCDCGLYGLKTPPLVNMESELTKSVYGKVELWGKIIYHEQGYRSEYARVHSLSPYVSCFFCGLRYLIEKRPHYDFESVLWKNRELFGVPFPLMGSTVRHIAEMPLSFGIAFPGQRPHLYGFFMCERCVALYSAHSQLIKDTLEDVAGSYGTTSLARFVEIPPARMQQIFRTLTELYCEGRTTEEINK